MHLTDAMRQTLILIDQYDGAVRHWYGDIKQEWSWRIGDASRSRSVDKCIRAGCLKVADRDRAVLTPLGRRVVVELKGDSYAKEAKAAARG